MSLLAVVALLQQLTPVYPFLSRTSSLCSSKTNALRYQLRDLLPLHAAEEDDADDLSSNFLNFLKKNKEEIVGQDDDEEEEEEEVTADDNKEETIKPSLFKEIISGATETLLYWLLLASLSVD